MEPFKKVKKFVRFQNACCYLICVECLVFLLVQPSSGKVSLPVDYLPHVEILEIVSSPLNRSTAVNLYRDRNSDLIIGEDTSATSRILMKCNATYPVQWVYLGDGKPEFTTFTNVKWQEDPDAQMSFEAEASLGLLGFHGVLREEDTGNYTCRSIQEPAVHSYYYIYVPGDGLFAAPNGTNITYTPQDQFVRIPCGVTHPKATVTLCKREKNDKVVCPVNGATGFNVKGGFLLNLKKQRDPSGTYICTGNYKRTVRIVEHNLMKEGEKPKPKPPTPVEPPPTYPSKGGKNLCDPSPCGKLAECSIVDGRAVCYCFRGLNGNPYDECAPGRCRSSKDCPRGKFCRQGQCTTDPCSPSPCGKGGECTVTRGNSKCSCKRGYTGLPPNCVKSCVENFECSEDEACIRNICQSPCPGPCGQNSECRVLANGAKRTAQCSCPVGLIGDPLKSCYKFNSTTPGPWNSCPPGYVGQPPACTRKECEKDTDCLYGRKCLNFVCNKGFNPACQDKCGHFAECQIAPGSTEAVCVCPPGTTGNPMVVCSSIGGSPPSEPPTSWGDPCKPNPCKGPAECQVVDGSRLCVCPVGFYGDPGNCIPTTAAAYPPSPTPSRGGGAGGGSDAPCRYDGDCPPGENCVDGWCKNLCGLCGYNAICEPAYQRKYRSISDTSSSGKLIRPSQPESTCSCPPGYEGNPYVSCMPTRNGSPPPQHPHQRPPSPPSSSSFPSTTSSANPNSVCFPSPCARFAECTSVNNAPLCRCFEGYEGDPYQECRYPTLAPPPPERHPPTRPSRPRPTEEDIFSKPPPGKATPVSPFELDFQGHSWGHHPDLNLNERDPFPPIGSQERDFYRPSSKGGGGNGPRFDSRPPYRDRPYPSPPYNGVRDDPPPIDGNFPPENLGDIPMHSSPLSPQSPSHYPSSQPHSTQTVYDETATPKTLSRPMSPLAPMSPTFEDRDECSFRNPYADYDMDSCGVGRRCERDYRGIKRCVCISPFDCTGPTSVYLRGKCKTNRDCLLSDHICINGTCGDPCSPSYSPCAGIAYSECRVIEGNVLCTCRRGYVGNPASGLDCRPKRDAGRGLTSVFPSSIASLENSRGDRNLLLIHYLNGSDQVVDLHDSHYNISTGIWNKNGTGGNSDENSGGVNAEEESDDGDDEGDVILSSGSEDNETKKNKEGSGSSEGDDSTVPSPPRHHRRHNKNNLDVHQKDTVNDLGKLLGRCGFGSGHNCDEKSHCRIIGGQPMCVCKEGYRGEFPNCKPECEKDEECPETMACQYHQCIDPCLEEAAHCAANAFCRVANHSAGCECEAGFMGVPWIQCTKIGDAIALEDCMGFNCEKRNNS